MLLKVCNNILKIYTLLVLIADIQRRCTTGDPSSNPASTTFPYPTPLFLPPYIYIRCITVHGNQPNTLMFYVLKPVSYLKIFVITHL